VSWAEIISGAVLALILVFVGVYFAVGQLRVLRRLRGQLDLPREETNYLRAQARRRMVSSVLLLVLALLLAGYLIFLGERVTRLERDNPADRDFLQFFSGYSIAFLGILLTVLVLAGIDFWTIRRYGRQQYRRLQEDRRAMIERQIIRLRQERDNLN
jgi:hypothetical protein